MFLTSNSHLWPSGLAQHGTGLQRWQEYNEFLQQLEAQGLIEIREDRWTRVRRFRFAMDAAFCQEIVEVPQVVIEERVVHVPGREQTVAPCGVPGRPLLAVSKKHRHEKFRLLQLLCEDRPKFGVFQIETVVSFPPVFPLRTILSSGIEPVRLRVDSGTRSTCSPFHSSFLSVLVPNRQEADPSS